MPKSQATLLSSPAFAQQTTGNISGRITDDQNAAVPGVTVTGRNTETGFVRTGVTDGEGIYRLTALPVGTYEIKIELSGFSTLTKEVMVQVGANIVVDFNMSMQALAENVQVQASTPLIETTTSVVGGVVDTKRIESMPLNGRQFANLGTLAPGTTLGINPDPTKPGQLVIAMNGGIGRNVNYVIDGGDNMDDTIGGALQNFSVEAVQEFNLQTQQYKAEYGRSSGGVLTVVTKSGTN